MKIERRYNLAGPKFKSTVLFVSRLRDVKKIGKQGFLIYDERLAKVNPAFRKFIKTFEFNYAVRAGEGLKDLSRFTLHLKKMASKIENVSFRDLEIFAAGGGSVGDFVGFFASVYKRGTELTQIPSTWLAAIDSAHGGKTALNLGNKKNQIGSFYPASRIWVVRELLEGQPPERFQEARGELAKTALIAGRNFGASSPAALWKILPQVIQEKYKIVSRDLFELTGVRQILNLGHTWGHVLELSGGLAHGTAVGLGLHFAVEWSHQKKFLSTKNFVKIKHDLIYGFEISDDRSHRLTKTQAKAQLTADKKLGPGGKMSFVFLRKSGKPFIGKVGLNEILEEAHRQEWLK